MDSISGPIVQGKKTSTACAKPKGGNRVLSVPNVLTILEVSRKQDYIFGAKELKENVRRSAEIAYVTSSPFFEKTAPTFYQKEKNLVYAGNHPSFLRFPGTGS